MFGWVIVLKQLHFHIYYLFVVCDRDRVNCKSVAFTQSIVFCADGDADVPGQDAGGVVPPVRVYHH
jgi:hypothetical protein